MHSSTALWGRLVQYSDFNKHWFTMANMPPCFQQIQTICSQNSDPSGGADSGGTKEMQDRKLHSAPGVWDPIVPPPGKLLCYFCFLGYFVTLLLCYFCLLGYFVTLLLLHQQSETQLFLLPESFTEAFVLINAAKVCFRGKYIQGCYFFLKTYSTGGLTKTFLGKKGQKSMFSGQNCRPGETRSDRLFMK